MPARAPVHTRQAGSGAPPDTPDGSDDDVVARQLREAAEKETDPVLKKKLWEEYRKYKEGTYAMRLRCLFRDLPALLSWYLTAAARWVPVMSMVMCR